jgi:Probable cobalt transporter subunit (CbtA)
MEIRVILRGALAGCCAGVLGFVFARIVAEPVINQAISYESGCDAILAQLNRAAGRPIAPDGPEIFAPSSPRSESPPALSRSRRPWAP